MSIGLEYGPAGGTKWAVLWAFISAVILIIC